MIVPIFGCEKIEAAAELYVDVLGFKEIASFSISDESIDPCYKTLDYKGGHLHLSSFPNEQIIGKSAYFYCDSEKEVEDFYTKIKNCDLVAINVPLVKQSWGMYEFCITDASGNRLSFGAQFTDEPPTYPLD